MGDAYLRTCTAAGVATVVRMQLLDDGLHVYRR
jgi:hypothetical protein